MSIHFWKLRYFIAGFLAGMAGSVLAGWRGSLSVVLTIVLLWSAWEWNRPQPP
jgi:hypothetical protein